ncbi:hypothetical protein DFH06DRAFT_522084 [Mycena polygramma]|nr:hypothetical protein DFH06DRAFT_522084 [Mycena polygramma]
MRVAASWRRANRQRRRLAGRGATGRCSVRAGASAELAAGRGRAREGRLRHGLWTRVCWLGPLGGVAPRLYAAMVLGDESFARMARKDPVRLYDGDAELQGALVLVAGGYGAAPAPLSTNFGNSAPCFCARRRVLEARATARCSIWITQLTVHTRKCRGLEPHFARCRVGGGTAPAEIL